MDKKKNHATFICELPPPYGGVTVKNKLLYELISQKEDIVIIDLMECKRSIRKIPYTLLKCIKEWKTADNIIYGIGTSERLKLLLQIQKLLSKSLFKTSVIAMGGVFDKSVLKDKFLKVEGRKLKGIWVETNGMKKNLNHYGFENVHIFPNPKTGKGSCLPRKLNVSDKLRVVYFSQISREKGVEDIFKTITLLEESYKKNNSIIFDFYGHVVEDFKEEFMSFVASHKNVNYHGIFDSTKNSLYKKLNEYDILLFPTHWDTEGVPGILVESKMAGLAVIASNKSFNEEIIREESYEGIIIKKDYAYEMSKSIIKLKENPELLIKLKENSFKSRERFELEKFSNICEELLS